MARGGPGDYRGLDVSIDALVKRKGTTRLQPILVHSFVPTRGLREAIAEEEEFVQRSRRIFDRYVYWDRRVSPDDELAPHLPIVVRYDSRLVRFPSLEAIASALFEEWYAELRSRFERLCTPRGRQPT